MIANRANEMLGQPLGTKKPVHPNDHVNKGQSSNDTFPTAMHIAVAMETRQLVASLEQLQEELAIKSKEFHDIVKVGRTHLQDAVPLTVGQELSAFVYQLREGRRRIEDSNADVYKLAIGEL